MLRNFKVSPPRREEMKEDMEALIHHFKLFTEGYSVPAGEVYSAIRGAEGRIRHLSDLDGANKPFRCKIRPPGFAHLSSMDAIVRGHMLARRRRDDRQLRHRFRGDRPVKATNHYAEVKDVDPLVALNAHTREHIDLWAAKFPPERNVLH
jgi:hypothetical protein